MPLDPVPLDPGFRTNLGPRTNRGFRTNLGLPTNPGFRTSLGLRPNRGCCASSGCHANIGRRASFGFWVPTRTSRSPLVSHHNADTLCDRSATLCNSIP